LKKLPITPFGKELGVSGNGSLFKNNFAICESLEALKKSAAKNIGARKNILFIDNLIHGPNIKYLYFSLIFE
jgi:hypothetical protein